jgi:hypothetical protein
VKFAAIQAINERADVLQPPAFAQFRRFDPIW